MQKLIHLVCLLVLTLPALAQKTANPIAEITSGGQSYSVTTNVPANYYAKSAQGLADFERDVRNGVWRLTTLDGCVIPVGTKPPATKPTCTDAIPSWLSGSWYDYNGNLLSVRATGQDHELRFERVDGQPFSLQNPDNIGIDNTKFYGHATINGVYQWQVFFPNAPALKLTYKNIATSATYTKTFTPVVGAANVNLFSGTTTPGSTTTTNPGSQTTTPGSSTAITAAGYGNVFAANSTYTEMPEQGRSGSNEQNGQYNRVYLTPPATNGVTVGLNLRVAGVLDYVSLPGAYNGKNMANSPIWGNGNLDMGRQWQYGYYGWPNGAGDEFTDPGTGQVTHGIGYQPLEGGDEGDRGEEADLKIFHKSNGLLYTKVQPFHWDLRKVKAEMYMEKWIRHDPNDPTAFRMHGRWTMFRTDPRSNEFPGGLRTHETPCFMMNVDFTDIRFATGKPYQGNWQTVQQAVGNGTQVRSTEPCLAAIDNRTGKGWAFYSPISGRWGHNRDIRRDNFDWQTSNEKDFVVFYVASTPFLVADKNGVYDMDMAAKYGTVDELKAWCYAQPRWSGKFNYVFNQQSRLGWFYNHAGDQLEQNINSYIEVVPLPAGDQQGKDMKFSSPEMWVNGEVVKKIYLDAEFVNGASQMKIVWSNPDSPTVERSKVFTVQPNTGRKIYTIDMTGVDHWDNAHMLGFSIQYLDAAGPGNYPDVSNVKWRFWSVKSDQ